MVFFGGKASLDTVKSLIIFLKLYGDTLLLNILQPAPYYSRLITSKCEENVCIYETDRLDLSSRGMSACFCHHGE